ncbi:MAG: tRNA 2-thiouridine(34) synthase MnmA [Lentisphaeria bacterium]|nr:tRNA 2-thiouridine(34) synthase MnmA [Lentisphaeria bacterium]
MSQSAYRPFEHCPPGSRVMVAFSGGVDSSVSAYLCLQAGLQVQAVTMSLLGPDKADFTRANETAAKLGIPLEIIDLSAEFERVVMRQTWEIYASGRTPNPCAVCNPHFKFGRLLEFARSRNCSALVTGHYARLIHAADGSIQLRKGVCREKDQSYFLFGLSPAQLAAACFPLGGMEKSEVRTIAAELGLPSADAPESQDACFAPADGGNLAEMLRCRFGEPAQTGDFVDGSGRVLGKHCGIHAYTIGQRKGTGVALGRPAYVKSIHADSRRIVLTPDPSELMSRQVRLGKANVLIPAYAQEAEFSCEVKIRYRSPAVPARVRLTPEGCLLTFEQPQRAVTPGQAAVFYDGDTLIGGAWIEQAEA